jgi:hypothetical protein
MGGNPATRSTRRSRAVIAAAWLPYLVASAAGVDTDPWNLTVVALPISFAIAFFGIREASAGGSHA